MPISARTIILAMSLIEWLDCQPSFFFAFAGVASRDQNIRRTKIFDLKANVVLPIKSKM
jgi:hypothetical protein